MVREILQFPQKYCAALTPTQGPCICQILRQHRTDHAVYTHCWVIWVEKDCPAHRIDSGCKLSCLMRCRSSAAVSSKSAASRLRCNACEGRKNVGFQQGPVQPLTRSARTCNFEMISSRSSSSCSLTFGGMATGTTSPWRSLSLNSLTMLFTCIEHVSRQVGVP